MGEVNMVNMAQIVLVSFAVIAMILAVAKYRQRRIGNRSFLLWLSFWIVAALVILFPDSTVVAARLLGIGRGADLVLYVGLILIFLLLFRMYVHLIRLDGEVTQIVRIIALRESGVNQDNRSER
jgi:hypothetical protein